MLPYYITTFVPQNRMYMKLRFLFLLVLPLALTAQTKKERKAMAKQRAATIAHLQQHIRILASDSLGGRRTGTPGEAAAADYVIAQWQQLQLLPQGTQGFKQPFTINEGKRYNSAATYLTVNGKALQQSEHFYPLAFSANKKVTTEGSVSIHESGAAWFIDAKEILDEQAGNPHFAIMPAIYQAAEKAIKKGATIVLIHNSGKTVDNILFNKNDTSPALAAPVLYITEKGVVAGHLTDATATVKIEAGVQLTLQQRNATNLVGFINNNAATTVIIGAHYDHLGLGEDKNALDGEGDIHNGADDNASGTAALIELARRLQQSPAKNNNYLFIAFSGEELGLLGSKYWLDHPTVNITPNYMINMDMIGRYDTAKKLTIGGYGTSPTWGTTLPNLIDTFQVKWDSAGTGPSDHASFYRKNIPVLFFFTNSHADYHKASDDYDKINYQAEADIITLIEKVITATNDKGKLAFTATREQNMGRGVGFTVSLGVIPDYAYSGTGVRIEGASKGKLGEKLGLQPGDILLQLGQYQFVDVPSYMQALSKFKKGDSTQLKIKRGSEEKTFDIVF
ncbi:MAG TPA: hypothetical protein DCL43_14310 [Chitinophagaceae bacterium]|nr:hypothetical protein [Chitinophagaceae bacterium]HAN37273.1 hypothetical protein [Chitinophagaceae bacterium]